MAIKGKVSRELYMTSGTIIRGLGEYRTIMTRAVMPRTKAMGSPKHSNAPKTRDKVSIIINSAPAESSHALPEFAKFRSERGDDEF
jgi:hypothetical protein